MNREKIKITYKEPLFDGVELNEIEYQLNTNLDKIVQKAIEYKVKEQNLYLYKRIIEKQQQEKQDLIKYLEDEIKKINPIEIYNSERIIALSDVLDKIKEKK